MSGGGRIETSIVNPNLASGTLSGPGAITSANQVVVWGDTTGLVLAAFTGSGIAHLASGVLTGSNIVNADVDPAAAIAYSKLSLSGSIVNADVASGAAIAYSKLNLAGSVSLTADITGTLAIGHGGTGQITKAAAFDALQPMSTLGDVIYGGASGTGTRLAGDTSNTRKFLRTQSSSGTAAAPAWDTLTGTDLPLPGVASLGGSFSKAAVSHQFLTAIVAADGSVTSAQPAFTDISGTATGAQLPLPAVATLGGVFSKAAVSNNFLTSISSVDGSVGQSQPSFSNISGTVAAAQLPLPGAATLGGVFSKAAVSHQFLTAIVAADGSVTSAQPAFTDISGSVAAAQLPNPSASTLGGIESLASVGSKWINTISTSGVPSATQPAFTDISGNIATSQVNSGTSASATTFFCGNNTWATPQSSTAGYFTGYFPGSSSNYWSTASATYADFTVAGTIPAYTPGQNLNFSTISGAGSSLPGFQLTAPHTGVIRVTAFATMILDSGAGTNTVGVKLVEAAGSVLDLVGIQSVSNLSTDQFLVTLSGYFSATATTVYTFKLQAKTSSLTVYIGAETGDACLRFAFEYVT